MLVPHRSPHCSSAPISPLPDGQGYCALFPDVLSRAECQTLVRSAEALGFGSAAHDYPPSYRDNERLVLDTPQLADSLYRRLSALLPRTLSAADDRSERWELSGLNPRLRFCRYRAGQQFRIHQDGVHHADAGQMSRLTFMIYLDEAPSFEGGDTLFYARGPEADGAPPVVARVRPRAGSLIVFDHALFHAGDVVTRGTKHILRSDLMYRRIGTASGGVTQTAFAGHRGYVWALLPLADGGLASGGRDGAIRLWSRTGAAQGQLAGHQQSVLGLSQADDGSVFSVSRDRTLRRWDLTQQRSIGSVEASNSAVLCVRTLGAERIATGSADHSIVLWDAALRAQQRLCGHEGWVWDVAAHTDTELWSAGEDGLVKHWQLATGRCLQTLAVDAPLRTLALSPDGAHVLAGDVRGRLSLFGERHGAMQLLIRVQAHGASVRRLRFLDATTLASAGEDGRVRCFAWSSLQPLSETRHDNFATDVVALADGSAWSAGYDGAIRNVRQRGNADAAS